MRKGISLIEVIVSFGVLAVLIVSIYPIIAWLTVRGKQIQYSAQAGLIMQEGIEAAYNVFLVNWNSTNEGRYSVSSTGPVNNLKWQLALLPGGTFQTVDTRYQRVVTVSTWCRNTTSGQLQKPIELDACISEPAPTISCDTAGGFDVDTKSHVLTSIVRWNENSTQKCIFAQTLVSRI